MAGDLRRVQIVAEPAYLAIYVGGVLSGTVPRSVGATVAHALLDAIGEPSEAEAIVRDLLATDGDPMTPDRDTPSWTHPHEARVAGDTLGTLLVCSVRYAIGRRTYMPSLIADIVRRHWQDIDAAARQTLRRDVGEAIDGPGSLGDACDAQTWRDLHAWMEAHHAD